MKDQTGVMFPDAGLVYSIRAPRRNIVLSDWMRANHEQVDRLVDRHGAVLMRGFALDGAAEFETVVLSARDNLYDYEFGASPRTRQLNNVFTSTEYPASEKIPLHSEMSYTARRPKRIWFYCEQPAIEGGETPLADAKRIWSDLPGPIREALAARRVRYQRNFGGKAGLRWQRAFLTESRADVEAWCARRGVEFEWLDDDRLRTREVCSASAIHPQTGDTVWMNQINLFHVHAQPEDIREILLMTYSIDDLPSHATFGDGEQIPAAWIECVKQLFETTELAFKWELGDVLVVDNDRMTHGRNPFSGPRRVLVAMTD